MLRHLCAPAFVIMMLCGCGRDTVASGDQIVAVVDGKELTTASLESALVTLPGGTNSRDPVVQRAVVEQLVDEMLLSAAARKQGLDRAPQVIRQLDRAERLILSNAYLRRTDGNTADPSDERVLSFFSAHPALFAERRRYRLRKLVITGTPHDLARYIQIADRAGGSVQALSADMASQRIAVLPEESLVDADAFGFAFANRLAQLKAGDNFNFRDGETQTFAEILAIDPSPVPLTVAKPLIRRLLAQQAQQDAVKATIGRLRGLSTIEYGKVGKTIMGRPKVAVTAGIPRQTPRT